MNNKKPIVFMSLLFTVFLALGVTLAYFTTSDTFNNEFTAGTYSIETQEAFVSPDSWKPGDTVEKTIIATNKGNTPAAVRIKLTPSWEDKNGNPLSLTDNNDNEAAVINFNSNFNDKWVYQDGYYYYKNALDENQSTTTLMNSVTFNPDVDINSSTNCNTVDGVTSCRTTFAGYSGGKYTLEVQVETCQYDKYQEIWGTTIEVGEPTFAGAALMKHDDDATKTFGKSIARDSFESITTVNSKTVPASAIDSWDVSIDQDEMVMAWYTDSDNDTKYELYIGQDGGVIANPDSSYAFYNFRNVATVDLTYYDTKYATNIGFIFYKLGYSSTTFSMDASNLNTSNVISMLDAFRECGYNATTWSIGNLDNWDTSKVVDMPLLFDSAGYSATTWSVGDLSNWDLSNVENINGVFFAAGYNATTFDISYIENWDVSNVKTMRLLFNTAGYNATTVNFGDLSNWNTRNVTTMARMFFEAAYKATSLDLSFVSSWDVSKVTDMERMFSYAGYSATTVNFGDVSDWDTSKVTRMDYMFEGAFFSSPTVDITSISSWNTGSVTNMTGMFYDCTVSIDNFSLDLTGWDVSNVVYFGYMFYEIGFSATTFNLDVTGWNTGSGQYMHNMFDGAGYSATTWSIGNLSGWDVSNVKNMHNVFAYIAPSASTVNIGNLGGWNTGSVTDMSYMFYGNGEGASTWYIGDLSNWNVSNVTDMSYMFCDSGYEATIWSIGNLSNWDTRKVTNMDFMFSYAGYQAGTWNSIGTLKVYASSVKDMFHDTPLANCTLNIYRTPSTYAAMFFNAATSGSGITVNYTSSVSNIDSLISTKSTGSNVVKGSVLS